MKVALVNLYELGRQPGALAEPAAWLRRAGHDVVCLDLSLDRLDDARLQDVGVVALSVPMYTATRLAVELIPRVRDAAPDAVLCAYGLYAPVNAVFLRGLGVEIVLGGECEPALVDVVDGVARDGRARQPEPAVPLHRREHLVPERSGLPPLSRYAHLRVGADRRTVGFVDSSRGCRHLCRHCPVVPIYEGRFYVVPVPVVLADIRAQIEAGARHLSFGDPDFFNGPGHAERIVRVLHKEFPDITYDATIKIEHLIHEARRLPLLKETGCLFVTSAVESVDDDVLAALDKGHTRADFERAAGLLRAAGIEMAPTFVPFTPWTTRAGYLALLHCLHDLRLVESVPPVQLAIRLLVPQGSRLLTLPGFRDRLLAFDPGFLGYPWRHEDPEVDHLQRRVQEEAATSEDRIDAFARIWRLTHETAGQTAPAWNYRAGATIPPHMSEPWYCCAEPVTIQRHAL